MRRFLMLLLVTGTAVAQTTTYTGTIKDLSLAVVTSGQVTFTLTPSTDSTIPGTGRFTPSTITCNINSDGTLSGFVAGVVSGACIVVSNTALSPTGTSYRICIQPQFATPGSCFFDYAVTTSKDISTIAPTLSTGPVNFLGPQGPQGVPGPPGPSGAATQAGFLSAAAYLSTTGTFAQMMTDAATANSTITISGATPLPNGTTTVSSDRNLLGLGGGNFTCPTGTCTLAFSGGNFDAPSRTVFGSNVVVTGLKVAKPEWWGGTNPLLSTAVNGLAAAGGKIILADQGKFVYRSGYDFQTTLVMSKNNIEIAGAGVCTPLDDMSTCTGGSRIIGEFDNSASFLYYHDFGVDDGCNAVTAIYSGTPSNGLVFANPGQALTFRQKTVNLERVSGLVCGASAAFHAALLENIDGLHVNTILAYGGTHGVVIKTMNSEVTGVLSKHHSSECFYIKSDFYAPAGSSSLHGLVASDCQDGLLIQGFDADLKGFTANGINCDSAVNTCLFVTGAAGFITNGIVLSDITSYAGNALFSDPTVSDLQVSNLTQISPTGSMAINSANTILRGCQILNVPVSVPAIIITASTSNALVSDCVIRGAGSFGSPLSAISIGAANTTLSNISLSGAWTGFCFVNVGSGTIILSNFQLTGSCTLGANNGNNFILNGNFQTTLVTTGSATPNVITVPGTLAPLGCRFEPANSAAAGDAANDFIDTIVLHSLTFHHSSTNAMAFRILCSY